MFVRFRKQANDGFRPVGVADGGARIDCRAPGWWGTCKGSCSLKPRCRWRVDEKEQRQPYRLKVVLVENRRVDGKVKQETVAVLGAIDATWLPEFWEGLDPKLKCQDWDLYSLRHRLAFWKKANKRLKQLANRLGPDLKRIRIAAHKRVPYPMDAGLKRLELLEAKKEYDFLKDHTEYLQRHIERATKMIKKLEKERAEDRESARKTTMAAAVSARDLAKLLGAQ